MKALVIVPVCPLMAHPDEGSERADEALLGTEVRLLEGEVGGWQLVETVYGYRGYAPAAALLAGDGEADGWHTAVKQVVLRGVCDALAAPNVRAPVVLTLTRGALVRALGTADGEGWLPAALPDGRTVYLKQSMLGPHHTCPSRISEDALRTAVKRTALSYLGVSYRWGGKTPLGIDCSGLTFMAYLLNGVVIWRDARIQAGYPVREIPTGDLRPADLLFFPGHVALYLGEGRYLHATAKEGCDGVVVNSLDPRAPDYRPDLAGSILAAGSIF